MDRDELWLLAVAMPVPPIQSPQGKHLQAPH